MKGKWTLLGSILAMLLLALAVGLARAQGPQPPTESVQPQGGAGIQATALGTAFTYQGQLKSGGNPVNGTCDFQFALYAAASGGTPLGTQTKTGVNVSNGLFTIPDLDFGAGAFQGDARWLQIGVKCAGDSDYVPLSPRQALTAAPYALSLRPGAYVMGDISGFPPGKIMAAYNTATSGLAEGVFGSSDSTSGTGVYGYAGATSGFAYGVQGASASTAGTGVYGYAPAASGTTYGVYGQSASTAGTGVYGLATATSGTTYGVYGRSDSTAGTGVAGVSTATTGDTAGVWGQIASSGTYARAVVGWATKTTGTNYGVWGESESSVGTGVYGRAPYVGVRGEAEGSANAVGVFGAATNAGCNTGIEGCFGVQGSSNKGIGVAGQTDAGVALQGYSSGNGVGLFVEGQLYGNLIEAWHGPASLDRKFYVSGAGEVYADGSFHSGGADFAELLPAAPGLEPGDVLVIGSDGRLIRSTRPYQTSVVGVYSTRPGFLGGAGDDADPTGKIPLAIMGVIPVKASAENGPIRPGDLLVASATPGHAMKAGPNPPQGTVIGKALEGLEKGTGVIQMLVVLQ